MLELETNAVAFNLACILIGLDTKNAKPSVAHFDPNPVEGSAVAVSVRWTADGKQKSVDAAEFIALGEKTLTAGEWIYTGSVFTPAGEYLADMSGTLIGFVHDPASVIEHRTGILGNFGAITVNKTLVPADDIALTLVVQRLEHKADDEVTGTPTPQQAE